MTSMGVPAQGIQPKAQTGFTVTPVNTISSTAYSNKYIVIVIVITTNAFVLLLKKRLALNKKINFIPL